MNDDEEKFIIDLCCGGRHMWIDKNCEEAVFMDIRSVEKGTITIQPNWSCEPDIIGSYTDIPFESESFKLAIWDIPHKIKADTGLITTKYGHLGDHWREDIAKGFEEISRILCRHGVMIFKFNDLDVPFKTVLALCDTENLPLKLIGFTPTKKGVNTTAFFTFIKM